MAELFNDKRIIFFKNKQRLFLQKIQKLLNFDNNKMSEFCHISVRTLTDWKREKFSLPASIAKKLSKKSNIKLPSDIKIFPPFWSTKKAAKLGGQALIRKYGKLCVSEEKRKKGWYNWWQTKGYLLENIRNKPIKVICPKYSTKLAELMGIIIGDGSITDYQITITLNNKDDKKYASFVIKLIEDLLKLKPSSNFRESVINIVISRKKLVEYFQAIGLKKGNKIRQMVDIPEWIKNSPDYSLACIRGLVDTDGCFYKHKYRVNNKWYSYDKINFTSRSLKLIQSVKKIMMRIGLNPMVDRRGDIRLNSMKDIKRYLKIVGSHNPKHIKKFEK